MRTQKPVVGIVGGGQLAQMMVHAADELGIECRVLARSTDESAERSTSAAVRLVEQFDTAALLSLADEVDVITFDHEPTDLGSVELAARGGAKMLPGLDALAFSDKAFQRAAFADADLPVPPFSIIEPTTSSPVASVEAFAADHAWPIVVKASRGGYDGRGVGIARTVDEATYLIDAFGTSVVLEPFLDLAAEIAVITIRTQDGQIESYPAVETLQRDGICEEVSVPSNLPDEVLDEAVRVAEAVAHVVGSVGILAVELFVVQDPDHAGHTGLLINEVAPRPHNSGHITIEACATSQFENHLRAVLGLPLGPTNLVVASAAMVNILGTADGEPPLSPSPGATIHRYAKTPRDGRKIGHVTATADTVTAASALARSVQR